jgi:ectoine hydroxylase-related dioxygenase (phytanoyl-CoA dioxygenase family)
VQERRELPSWKNWSIKRGAHHVQPQAKILARMVTLRLHLDDCPVENGALRVLPGSHRQGVLSREAIRSIGDHRAQAIPAKAGDALFMRPLMLHASRAAETPAHRRVLHLEFAPDDLLPSGLFWAEG